MKGSIQIATSASIILMIILLLVDRSEGNPRSQVIKLTCDQQLLNNSDFIVNFARSMVDIQTQILSSNRGLRGVTAVAGTGPNSSYALANCYGDLSGQDCASCYQEASRANEACVPHVGSRIFLDGCFVRTQNYNFFEEYTGRNDTVICAYTTKDRLSWDSVTQAVSDAVKYAVRNRDYFARTAVVSWPTQESTYVLANCWGTLNESSCKECLEKASNSILQCFPWSEGRALYTGCFLRYSNYNFLNAEPTRGNNKGKIIAIVMAVTAVVMVLIASIITFYVWRHKSKLKRRQGSDATTLLKIVNNSSLNFKYSMIEKATGCFNEANKLGHGAFGAVYKGVLPDGREIAAKRLFFNQRHRAGDFYHEVNIISSVDHKNLVKLVGFSFLGPESILIYEYLPNRSLNHFIFDAVRGKELNWAKRFDVIVGIAEGLAYLHENSKTRIIHRDIKAANILLDSRLRAKIADFGLARSFQEDKNHISTGIAGTLGYMAPEYVLHGNLTEKVDVYSFGVLLLEVVTGIPNRGIQTSEHTHSLVSIVWTHFKQGSVDELFDQNLMLNSHTSINIKKEIESVIQIGLLCTQEVPSLRPTMSMTLQMLSKNIEPLPSPANPPYLPETNLQTNKFGLIDDLRLRVNDLASFPTVTDSSLGPR